jgi:alkyldihydroxyacetonephosphate synthase
MSHPPREPIEAMTCVVSDPVVPDPIEVAPEEAEAEAVWGFADTAFEVNAAGRVALTGTRYALSGHELPSLLPWMADTLGVELDPNDPYRPHYPPEIPPPRVDEGLLASLRAVLREEQIRDDARVRLRHGHGHTQEEMYAIKYGRLERVPDLVVCPESREQVRAIVEAVSRHGACLIPYGGGTNVTDALRCPAGEARVIVSVDLGRMNRILWIDPSNRMACIEAGAVGRHIEAQLAEHGFTIGHEPDSIEFSTLGGWIATNASGMKKNRYGNIEEIVLDVEAVTPSGEIARRSVAPRESVGTDPRRWLIGSEGNLGIITRAVVKIFPLPEVKRFGSILFHEFSDGVGFLRELNQSGSLPASVRLVDNLQFQFSQALKPASKGFAGFVGALQKWFVLNVKGFDPQRMVACTLVFEGGADEVTEQERRVYKLAKKYRGTKSGSENGERGYQLTFSIAYIRDFAMNHWIIGESFETSVPWSQLESLCDNVRHRLWQEHEKRGLPGKPFVTCRVTQLYDTGVCVYFYSAFFFKGVDEPSQVYSELENAAREEILRSGGSLSHHHGIGKLRAGFVPEIMSPGALEWRDRIKRAVDPDNLFGAANSGLRRSG